MSPRRLRVLVVDDSLLQRRHLQELLDSHDFELLTAENGAEGVDTARHRLPDIILMDIEMPVLDGLEAAQQIRNGSETMDIPIIMVTSRGEADFMESAFVGGCNDYITKPVHQDELLAKIASLTGYQHGALT
ncbi:MAG: response regulator receiver protein [Moraxellaceae bacterium]|jgi:CheY-like chemotaxis protein|nr:response regulator receiver protein [Moraxellaceae bacterium]